MQLRNPQCERILFLIRYLEYTVCYSVSWGCRIHRLPHCRGGRLPVNECPVYETKQSDGAVPMMLELWGMRSIPSLPSLPSTLWPRVAAPDRALSIGQIELNCVLMLNWIVWNCIVWNRPVWLNGIAWNKNVFDD